MSDLGGRDTRPRAAAWSALCARERLRRLGSLALARLPGLEAAKTPADREAAQAQYHLHYAEANLYLHLASDPGLADRERLKARLLHLMDHEAFSPMGNRMALNDGRYRTVLVRLLADLLSNMQA